MERAGRRPIKDFFVTSPAFSEQELGAIARQDITPATKVALLTQALAEADKLKESARILYEQTLRSDGYTKHLRQIRDLLRRLDLDAPESLPVDKFGAGAFYLSFEFSLHKPFLSKDDVVFYCNDNPVRKDKLFGLPMVSPSTWKGNLRAAARATGMGDREAQMVRLFGNPKAEEADFRQGRLRLYPTFFEQIGFEIINPHDRKTRTGKNPIRMECVPAGASGRFGLLYVPFPQQRAQSDDSAQDLHQVVELLDLMLTLHGFSAKKTSGYGIIEATVRHGKLEQPAKPPVVFTSLDSHAGAPT